MRIGLHVLVTSCLLLAVGGGVHSTEAPASTADVLVVVPGTTGSVLRDPDRDRYVWGLGRNLIRPRDRGYDLLRRVEWSPTEGGFEPSPMEAISLAWKTKPIYAPVLAAMEEIGWRKGSFDAPTVADDLFLFSYDFRLDSLAAVRRLADGLERIRRSKDVDTLGVRLLCQSNGGHICRFFVRHGGATLEEAESGRRRPATLRVDRVVLVAASNGGAMRMFRILHQGRSYLDPIGRRIAPEVVFTWPSLFQDLPRFDDLFVDDGGRPVAVDLFDSQNWTRYGWSAFGRKARERVDDRELDALGGEAARVAYLDVALDRSARFHRLLERPAPVPLPPYFMVANGEKPTARRAVLARDDGVWTTRFFDERPVKRDPVLVHLTAVDGDGHATLDSVNALPEAEREALARPLLTPTGGHFELLIESQTLSWLQEVLGGPR